MSKQQVYQCLLVTIMKMIRKKQNRNPRMMNSNNKFQMYSTLTYCHCFIQHKLIVWTKNITLQNKRTTSYIIFQAMFFLVFFIMHNLHEFIHIRKYVYVIQLPTYNLVVRDTGKFATLFQIISHLHVPYFHKQMECRT